MVQYNPSSASFTITWAALYVDTVLTAIPSTTNPLQGEIVTVTGKLTRADTGAPIAGATIELWHGDHITGTLLTSAITNSLGNYSISWTSQFEGSVTYECYFPGMIAAGLTYNAATGTFTTGVSGLLPLLLLIGTAYALTKK